MTKHSQSNGQNGETANLAVVFTDIVGSTVMIRELGDKEWGKRLTKHYSRARLLASRYDGDVIKTIGDGCLIAFPTVDKALTFLIAFSKDAGHPSISIRAGVHVGPVQIVGKDLIGTTVHFTKRVEEALKKRRKGPGIAFSSRAKTDLEQILGPDSKSLGEFRLLPHNGLQGFVSDEVLWEFVIVKAKRLVAAELATAPAESFEKMTL